MSDVDVVGEIYDCMANGEVERLLSLVDPSIVVTQDPAVPWGGRFEGTDGLATFALTLRGNIDSKVTIDSIFEADGDVFEVGRTRGTVVATGVPFDVAEVHRWTITNGLAVAAHFAIDTPAMLAALAQAAESCPVCGFVWTSVPRADIGPRVEAAAATAAALVRAAPADSVAARPAPETWSPLEYAAHLRDVFYNIRDRLVVGLAEENPSFKPMYRNVRIDAGLYAGEDPAVVADELERAGALFARTVGTLDDTQLARPCVYSAEIGGSTSLLWVGQQAVHEGEHHGADIATGLGA